jgi:hypothetical protein
MNDRFIEYYLCPEQYSRLALKDPLPPDKGYFRFGQDTICYGAYRGLKPSPFSGEALENAARDVRIEEGTVYLPFDPSQIVDNLRGELYVKRKRPSPGLSNIYYLIRPLLSVALRKHLQRFHLRGWDKLLFPRWPVDCSIDSLQEELMLLNLKAAGVEKIPFIWFWPDANSSCAIMTHDVETLSGRDFCAELMDIDDSFGIKASFQIIPEERYLVTQEFLESIRSRGFEVVIHDLNHDGHLFQSREEFLRRAIRIDSYRELYNAEGFRSAVLYREQLWYDALNFSYDMSVPNVAHLDPQRGGCCTVMPYFLGDVLEIPVTTVQDYTLFNILRDYSTTLWERQIELILQRHGCMSFIVHPDYVMKPRELDVYRQLLEKLCRLQNEKQVWLATPREVNCWWRQRSKMRLVPTDAGWKIEGPGKECARVAYASEQQGRLVVTVEPAS